jgi:hypothetical protein
MTFAQTALGCGALRPLVSARQMSSHLCIHSQRTCYPLPDTFVRAMRAPTYVVVVPYVLVPAYADAYRSVSMCVRVPPHVQ